jgi:hypothetical protein
MQYSKISFGVGCRWRQMLFYEVKANLKKDGLRLMRDGGIPTIQPDRKLQYPILNQI